jgi:hypothetical protein
MTVNAAALLPELNYSFGNEFLWEPSGFLEGFFVYRAHHPSKIGKETGVSARFIEFLLALPRLLFQS